MTTVRLNKYISESGIASRRKADELISEGRVSVNRNVILDFSTRIDPEKDRVDVDGENIRPDKKTYILLYKPRSVITSTIDERNRTTVVDLINSKNKIYPVGRLDYNTTGVLLLTNDGDFSYFLTHPKHKIPRTYLVTLTSPLQENHKLSLLSGVYIDNKKGRFQNISFPSKDSYKVVEVETVEGRNHFVKNMFSALNYTVKKLHRLNYAGFNLNKLKPGEYRNIEPEEISKVYKQFNKKNSKRR